MNNKEKINKQLIYYSFVNFSYYAIPGNICDQKLVHTH